jgi:hypothetical protein
MKRPHLIGVLCGAAFILVTSLANAVILPLESRLGGLAYYDPNLDITWAADANINSFDIWDNQVVWAAGLDIGGVTGWRLPSADVNGDNTVIDCAGGGVGGCEDNEMGFLFWEEGISVATPGPFSNVQVDSYWSGTEFAPLPANAWRFNFTNGAQFAGLKNFTFFAWAVHSGDVGAVPVPAAVWLFGSGLLGLIGITRRKKAA